MGTTGPAEDGFGAAPPNEFGSGGGLLAAVAGLWGADRAALGFGRFDEEEEEEGERLEEQVEEQHVGETAEGTATPNVFPPEVSLLSSGLSVREIARRSRPSTASNADPKPATSADTLPRPIDVAVALGPLASEGISLDSGANQMHWDAGTEAAQHTMFGERSRGADTSDGADVGTAVDCVSGYRGVRQTADNFQVEPVFDQFPVPRPAAAPALEGESKFATQDLRYGRAASGTPSGSDVTKPLQSRVSFVDEAAAGVIAYTAQRTDAASSSTSVPKTQAQSAVQAHQGRVFREAATFDGSSPSHEGGRRVSFGQPSPCGQHEMPRQQAWLHERYMDDRRGNHMLSSETQQQQAGQQRKQQQQMLQMQHMQHMQHAHQMQHGVMEEETQQQQQAGQQRQQQQQMLQMQHMQHMQHAQQMQHGVMEERLSMRPQMPQEHVLRRELQREHQEQIQQQQQQQQLQQYWQQQRQQLQMQQEQQHQQHQQPPQNLGQDTEALQERQIQHMQRMRQLQHQMLQQQGMPNGDFHGAPHPQASSSAAFFPGEADHMPGARPPAAMGDPAAVPRDLGRRAQVDFSSSFVGTLRAVDGCGSALPSFDHLPMRSPDDGVAKPVSFFGASQAAEASQAANALPVGGGMHAAAAPSAPEAPPWVIDAPMMAMDMKKKMEYMHPQADLLQASYAGACDVKAFGGMDGPMANAGALEVPYAAGPLHIGRPPGALDGGPPLWGGPADPLSMSLGGRGDGYEGAQFPPRFHEVDAGPRLSVGPGGCGGLGSCSVGMGMPHQQQPPSIPQGFRAAHPSGLNQVPPVATAGLATRLGTVIQRLERDGDPGEVISDLRDIEASYNAALNARLR